MHFLFSVFEENEEKETLENYDTNIEKGVTFECDEKKAEGEEMEEHDDNVEKKTEVNKMFIDILF